MHKPPEENRRFPLSSISGSEFQRELAGGSVRDNSGAQPGKNHQRCGRIGNHSKTNFWFNLIVVDNHSTDGTTEILEKYAKQGLLIHLIPERKDLGIGGCWNEGIFHENCGRFAVQLDSDDLYASENTLQTIVNKFIRRNAPWSLAATK